MSKNVFLDIHKDKLIAEIRWPNGFKTKEVITSIYDVENLFDEYDFTSTIHASSTLDFPEEETDNQEVIDLCKLITNSYHGL